ncbi:MAG: 3-hydroxyacyl-CoA dehydrogenase NAD-binding domain-containing protein [Pseudomonadota bacterium]
MTQDNKAMAVVGGGTMGVGIAYVYAVAGWATWVVEPDDGRTAVMRKILSDAAQGGAKRGKLSAQQVAQVEQGITRVAAVADLPAGLDLVVESVPERLALKQQVLTQVAAVDPRVIATNTSALSVNELAGSVRDATRFLGMHFFNPVWSLPMVEIIRGDQTSEASLALAREFAESTGKTTITVRDVPGFATSRLDLIASLEAMRMLQDGVASAEDIDRAMVVAYRHPMGPLRLSDIVGLDVRLDIARNLRTALGERYAPPRILEEMVARGELGQKSGKGFFDWPDAKASAAR